MYKLFHIAISTVFLQNPAQHVLNHLLDDLFLGIANHHRLLSNFHTVDEKSGEFIKKCFPCSLN